MLKFKSFFSTLRISFPSDLSIEEIKESEYSTTVTSVPNLPYTEPNSKPITPPPITTIRLGTSFKLKASVEVMTRSLSILIKGNVVGFDPVAIIVFAASI